MHFLHLTWFRGVLTCGSLVPEGALLVLFHPFSSSSIGNVNTRLITDWRESDTVYIIRFILFIYSKLSLSARRQNSNKYTTNVNVIEVLPCQYENSCHFNQFSR